jgi:hypothetical protein
VHPYATERHAVDHLGELDREAARVHLAALARAAEPSGAAGAGAIHWRAVAALDARLERLGAALGRSAQGHGARAR